MIRRACVLTIAAALCCASVHAQAPAAEAIDVSALSVAALQEMSPAPLTLAEKRDIEVLTLKAQLAMAAKTISDLQATVGQCQAQLGPAVFEQSKQSLSDERTTLKNAIEQARPGFTWNPDTGTFTKKPAEKPKS